MRTQVEKRERHENEGPGPKLPSLDYVTEHAHTTASTQDWTSGPDRYQITQGREPEWGWTRLFTFFAYAASKYHVLETTDAPLAQKASTGLKYHVRRLRPQPTFHFSVPGGWFSPQHPSAESDGSSQPGSVCISDRLVGYLCRCVAVTATPFRTIN